MMIIIIEEELFYNLINRFFVDCFLICKIIKCKCFIYYK